jgi:hypothetical protein
LGDQIEKDEIGKVGRIYGGEERRGEVHTWFWWEIWGKETKLVLQEVGWGAWTGLIWFRTGMGNRHL